MKNLFLLVMMYWDRKDVACLQVRAVMSLGYVGSDLNVSSKAGRGVNKSPANGIASLVGIVTVLVAPWSVWTVSRLAGVSGLGFT